MNVKNVRVTLMSQRNDRVTLPCVGVGPRIYRVDMSICDFEVPFVQLRTVKVAVTLTPALSSSYSFRWRLDPWILNSTSKLNESSPGFFVGSRALINNS